jgi:hypothetical protein
MNFKNHTLIHELFPSIWNKKSVQNIIKKYSE